MGFRSMFAFWMGGAFTHLAAMPDDSIIIN